MNIFLNLPVPVANGVGATVDTSSMGRLRTVTLAGSLGGGTVTVEASNDGVNFVPVLSLRAPSTRSVSVAAAHMRARVAGAATAVAANLDVASNDDGTVAVNLPAPAGTGTGAAVDVSALGTFNTAIVTGAFSGTCIIEVSEDNVDWAPLWSFADAGAHSAEVVAQFARVRRVNVSANPGTVNVDLAAVNDSSAAAAARPVASFVYAPGGVAGDNVYTDWDLLMAALNSVDGYKQLEFRDEFVSPCPIPAGGPYEMLDVEWYATREHAADGTKVLIDVIEGVTFSNLRMLSGELEVDVRATATVPDETLADNDVIRMRWGAQIEREVPGAVPMWRASNFVATDACTLLIGPNCSFLGPGPLIDMPVAGTTLRVNGQVNSLVESDTISGDAGATLFVFVNATSFTLSPTQPSFLGTFIDFPLTNVRMLPDQALVAANAAVSRNSWKRFDTTASNRAANLPAALGLRGQFVGVSNEAGANAVNVTPAGADTVDGVAAVYPVAAGGSALLMSDGVSNWIIVAERN